MTHSKHTAQVWDCGKMHGAVKAELRGGTLTVRGSGEMKDYSSGAYKAPWYGSRHSITNAVIEGGVASIGAEMFWGCSSLTSVAVPASVLDISPGAFWGCTGLTSIDVALENACYSSVDGALFYTKDGEYRLQHYPAGKLDASYAIPNGVTAIGKWAFFGCAHLNALVIPNSVESINRSFAGCNGLTAIETASGNARFRSVDGVLFYTGDKDEYILLTYPSGRQGAYAVPNGVTRLRENAFLDCVGLTSVSLPNTLMFIENHVFSGCSGLSSITVPRNVMLIENWAFSGCDGLMSIEVAPGNDSFRSIDGVLLRAALGKDELAAFPAGKQGAYTVPGSVTSIESMAFFNCAGLTSVVIPDSVTYIGGCAFMECYGLTSVAIGGGVTFIGSGAFAHCRGLASVISLGAVPPAIEANKYGIFDVFDADTAACLYVPKNCVAIYKMTEGWKVFGSIKSTDDYVPAVSKAAQDSPPEDAAAPAGSGFAAVKSAGTVKFFRRGSRIENTKLHVYDLSGDMVRTIKIGDHSDSIEPSDDSAESGRPLGLWDLRDMKGRPVPGGTYLVKGEIKMSGGKRERVSAAVDIR